jgi:hypothetical protein
MYYALLVYVHHVISPNSKYKQEGSLDTSKGYTKSTTARHFIASNATCVSVPANGDREKSRATIEECACNITSTIRHHIIVREGVPAPVLLDLMHNSRVMIRSLKILVVLAGVASIRELVPRCA